MLLSTSVRRCARHENRRGTRKDRPKNRTCELSYPSSNSNMYSSRRRTVLAAAACAPSQMTILLTLSRYAGRNPPTPLVAALAAFRNAIASGCTLFTSGPVSTLTNGNSSWTMASHRSANHFRKVWRVCLTTGLVAVCFRLLPIVVHE